MKTEEPRRRVKKVGKLAGVGLVGVGGFPEKSCTRTKEWRVIRKNDRKKTRKISSS